jgi:pilus assembly protein CpaF
VNIIFPPLSLLGPCLSIRKFAKRKIDFGQMVRNGSISPQMARVLEVAARAGSTSSSRAARARARRRC